MLISIYNISSNKIFKLSYIIYFNNDEINYYPFSKLFSSLISLSYNSKVNLKNVIPVENISLFSGLNSPNPDF